MSAKFFNDESYKNFFEQSPEAFLIIDPESGVILECNQVAAELFERTKIEMIGQHESILYPPQEMEKGVTQSFEDKVNQSKKGGVKRDIKVITKSNRIKDVFIKADLMNVDGKRIIYESLRDVTEQKQSEAAIRYSEEQFHNLAEDWPNMIAIIQDGRVVYLNQECVKVTGYSKQEIMAPDFDLSKLMAPEFLPIFFEEIDKRIKGVNLDPLEFRLKTKNGSPIDAIWSTRPIKLNGKLGLIGVGTDITERKRNEDQIVTQKRQLEAIFASSPDAITVTDMAGKILDCNQAASSMIGFTSKEEAIGKSIFQLISPQDQKRALKALAQVLETGTAVKNLEFTFLANNGNELPVECSGAVIRDSSGKPQYLVTITHDISERKAMQEKLQQERDVLNAVTRSINAGFVMVDRDYKIVWSNEFTKSIFGAVEGKLSYQTLNDFENRSLVPDYSIKKVLEENASEASHEIQITDAKDNKFWLKISAAPIKNAEGEVVAAAELAVDITDVKQAEEQIRLLSNVVEQEVDGIAVSDNQGRTLFLNKSWISMHELTDNAESLIGQPIVRFYDPDQLKAIGNRTDTDGVFRGRLKQISKDGTSFTTLATLSPLRDKEGKTVGTIHTAKKLTEIVREIRDVGSHA